MSEPGENVELGDGAELQDRVVVDLNEATEVELQELPGIGQALAARIVDYREALGGFSRPADLVSVQGIGDVMYEQIAGHVTVVAADVPVVSEPPEAEPEMEDAGVEQADGPGADEEAVHGGGVDAPEGGAEVDEPSEALGVGGEPPAPPEPGEELSDDAAEALEVTPEEAGEELAEPPELEEEEPSIESLVVPAPLEEALDEDAEPEEPDFPPLEAAPPRPGWSCWSLALVGLLAVAAGALLALVALRMINGTLNFRAAASSQVQAETLRLEGELSQIQGSLAMVEERMQAIEELDLRLDGVEAEIDWLVGDVDAMQQEMDRLDEELALAHELLVSLESSRADLEEGISAIEGQISLMEDGLGSLQGQLDALRQGAQRFDSFLHGLHDLLGDTMWPSGEQPPSLPRERTPQPMMTVIPLSTPTP